MVPCPNEHVGARLLSERSNPGFRGRGPRVGGKASWLYARDREGSDRRCAGRRDGGEPPLASNHIGRPRGGLASVAARTPCIHARLAPGGSARDDGTRVLSHDNPGVAASRSAHSHARAPQRCDVLPVRRIAPARRWNRGATCHDHHLARFGVTGQVSALQPIRRRNGPFRPVTHVTRQLGESTREHRSVLRGSRDTRLATPPGIADGCRLLVDPIQPRVHADLLPAEDQPPVGVALQPCNVALKTAVVISKDTHARTGNPCVAQVYYDPVGLRTPRKVMELPARGKVCTKTIRRRHRCVRWNERKSLIHGRGRAGDSRAPKRYCCSPATGGRTARHIRAAPSTAAASTGRKRW